MKADIRKWVAKLNTSDRYKYNKETVTALLSALADGYGRVAACKKAGIHHSTFFEWLEKKEGFAEAIKKAEAIGLLIKRELCEQKILKEESWQSAAWWLERNFPDQYALRSKLEHTIQVPKIVVEDQEQADKIKKLESK